MNDETTTDAQAVQLLTQAELIADAASVADAYDRVAAEITQHYLDHPPASTVCLLVVMTGGFPAAAEIGRRLDFPLVFDYVHATRYRGNTRGAELVWKSEPHLDLDGRDILIVDDILDEGHTLVGIQEHCRKAGARSIVTAVLVAKQHDRLTPDAQAQFVGLEVPDRYVFGCGMDVHDHWRHLDAIYAMKPGADAA